MSSKLFSFSRPLPEPFDKVKRKVKVSSKYGDGDGVHALLHCG